MYRISSSRSTGVQDFLRCRSTGEPDLLKLEYTGVPDPLEYGVGYGCSLYWGVLVYTVILSHRETPSSVLVHFVAAHERHLV